MPNKKGSRPEQAMGDSQQQVTSDGWSQITDHVTYLSVRPDPDRVLPAGYVYPLLLKNLPTPAK